MLNKSKIESLINYGESNPSAVARGTGINYQSLISKIKSGSWSPDDVERLADHFKKPIAYFFDREELPRVNEEQEKYGEGNCCKMCEDKERIIAALNKVIDSQEKMLNKKETGDDNSAQYRQASNE